MKFANIFLSIILFCSVAGALGIAFYSHKRRNIPGCKYFIWLCIIIAWYCFGYGMELLSTSLATAYFWNGFQYLAIPYICLFGVYMAFDYTDNKIFPRKGRVAWILYTIPEIFVLIRLTNGLHHLYYTHVRMLSNGYFPILHLEKGSLYALYVIYITLMGIVSTFVYFVEILRASSGSKAPMASMFVATLFPWIATYFNLTNIAPLGLDYCAITLALSLMMYMIGIFRFRMFRTIPIGRDAAFHQMKEGILILDNNDIMVDCNRSAMEILHQLPHKNLDKAYYQLFPDWPELKREDCEDFHSFSITKENKTLHYSCSCIILRTRSLQRVGTIVTIADTTRHHEIQRKLEALATTDPLTGLFNRRYLFECFERELGRSLRMGGALSIIMMDVDHFKDVNDRYGHDFGDQVLKRMGELCIGELRNGDVLSRYGGEEFLILLPATAPERAAVVAERIRRTIEETKFAYFEERAKITSSFGVSGYEEFQNGTCSSLIIRSVDEALYKAKELGRNKVVRLELLVKNSSAKPER